jgi:opacity protein-like surface antigen
MRSVNATALAIALTVVAAGSAAAQDVSQKVANGGIHVPGWKGRIDASEAKAGQVLENSRLAKEGDALHITTGPSVVYWQPEHTASGSYTVKATFREPAYMSLNNHPHPYGVVIGGSDMGTDAQRYLYCAAYGNGNFIVRGFGPEAFQVNGRRGEAHAAVNKAADKGQPVVQEIALSVKGDKVECAINGTVVGSYDKASVLGEGKLKSTDGVYGVRVGHNAEAIVTGLGVTKH